MKIILSRKGFDSSEKYGQVASPIFPDGSMVSMPIPSSSMGSIPYGKISTALDLNTLGSLAADITLSRPLVIDLMQRAKLISIPILTPMHCPGVPDGCLYLDSPRPHKVILQIKESLKAIFFYFMVGFGRLSFSRDATLLFLAHPISTSFLAGSR